MTLYYFNLSQNVGRVTIVGHNDGFLSVPCSGGKAPWTVQIAPSNGKFAGGKASLSAFALACILEPSGYCSVSYGYELTTTIQLTGGGK